jgi:hypothetical protein
VKSLRLNAIVRYFKLWTAYIHPECMAEVSLKYIAKFWDKEKNQDE